MDDVEFRTELHLWADEIKTQRKDRRQHAECDARAYAVLLQHCPPAEEEALKADSRWEKVRDERSGLLLARMIRDMSHDVTEHRHPVLTAVEGSLGLFTTMQEENQPLDDYLARFLAQVEQIKAHQGCLWRHPKLVDLQREAAPNASDNVVGKAGRRCFPRRPIHYPGG